MSQTIPEAITPTPEIHSATSSAPATPPPLSPEEAATLAARLADESAAREGLSVCVLEAIRREGIHTHAKMRALINNDAAVRAMMKETRADVAALLCASQSDPRRAPTDVVAFWLAMGGSALLGGIVATILWVIF